MYLQLACLVLKYAPKTSHSARHAVDWEHYSPFKSIKGFISFSIVKPVDTKNSF